MNAVQDDLHRRVRDAIASLPAYFRTETKIEGVNATDLHTLNTVLGATIEEQVVRTLNDLRNSWDQAVGRRAPLRIAPQMKMHTRRWRGSRPRGGGQQGVLGGGLRAGYRQRARDIAETATDGRSS